MLKKIHSKQAVSEVVGVILLLGITITLFVILNNYVFHFSFNPSSPTVNLIGTIDKTNDLINIKHNGGESLEGNTEIIITVGSTINKSTVQDIMSGADANWKLIKMIDDEQPDKWDFGEIIQFNSSTHPIDDEYVLATVVDVDTNSVLLSVILNKD